MHYFSKYGLYNALEPNFRPFKCEFCDKSYYRKNVFKSHLVKCKAIDKLITKKEDALNESLEDKSFKSSQSEELSSKNFENDNQFDYSSEDPVDAEVESLPTEKKLSK